MPPTTYRATVEQIDTLAYNVRGLRLKLIAPSAFEFTAGQFVTVHAQDNGRIVKRAYSIASPPHEHGIIELCVQHTDGPASAYFRNLKPGHRIAFSGPSGRFALKEPLDYDPVFMGAGAGVAPLRAMIRHLIHRNVTREIWLLFECEYEHAILYESEFRALASVRKNFRFLPTVSRPKEWRGAVGHVQELFKQHLSDLSDREIYLAGWGEEVRTVAQDLHAFGVPRERVHTEAWT